MLLVAALAELRLVVVDAQQAVGHPPQQVAVVGDDDGRPLEAEDGVLHGLHGVDVHVVGGLVQQQQVHALADQGGHGEPRPLAAGEHGDGLVHVVAPELELGQEAQHVLLGRQGDHRLDLLEHSVAGVQVLVVLVEVAELHLAAQPGPAGDEGDLLGDGLQQRGLAGAVQAHDGQLLAPLDLEVLDGLEERLAIPADAHVVQHEGGVAAALGLGELELHLAAVPQRLVDALELGQVGAAAPGDLGVLPGDVAADVILLLADVVLLPLVVPLGDLQLLLLLLDELGVVALVDAGAPQFDLQDAGGHAVQEVAVVADDGHRGPGVVQEALQPAEAGQVQVVGGLVQQQQVLPLEDGLRQHHAALLAAGELVDVLLQHLRREAQGEEDALGPGTDGEAVLAVEGLLDLLVAVHDLLEVNAGLRHAVLQFPHLMLQGLHLPEGCESLLQDAAVGLGLQVLGVVAHADAALRGGAHDGPLVELELTQQDLEEGALARAVASDDAPALVLLQSPGDVPQDFLGTEAQVGVVEGSEHRRSLG